MRTINDDEGSGDISIRNSSLVPPYIHIPTFFLYFDHLIQCFLSLSLPDKPICRSEQKRIYGVARNEAAEILCEVDAYPPPESFKWSFNNTAETFEMPQSDYRIHSSQASTLSYTPVKVLFLKLFIFRVSTLHIHVSSLHHHVSVVVRNCIL